MLLGDIEIEFVPWRLVHDSSFPPDRLSMVADVCTILGMPLVLYTWCGSLDGITKTAHASKRK